MFWGGWGEEMEMGIDEMDGGLDLKSELFPGCVRRLRRVIETRKYKH